MGRRLGHLQPGCLYISIAIPPLAPYQPLPANFYLPYLLDDFDPTRYETSNPTGGLGREEFDWGLYWLHDHQQGTWYTLRPAPDSHTEDNEPPTSHALFTATVPPSAMRLNPCVVGLIHVLSLPASLAAEMPAYLDWLTACAAPAATRTFLWATTAYLRCRKHVENTHAGGGDGDGEGPRPFEINLFLREALEFAYGEVWYGIVGGQVPRPIMASGFGVELVDMEGPDDIGGIKKVEEGDNDEVETMRLESWQKARVSS